MKWDAHRTIFSRNGKANDSELQEAERLTNIHIEWQHPIQGSEAETFNLIMVSQNYPDAMMCVDASYYVGGYDKYVDEDIILDLTDLISEYAPNYNDLRNSDDDIRRRTMTDEGRVPYFRTINKTLQPSFFGNMVRQDWLTQLATPDFLRHIQSSMTCLLL